MRFKHGGIRLAYACDTARQKLFLSMVKNFVRVRTYMVYTLLIYVALIHNSVTGPLNSA